MNETPKTKSGWRILRRILISLAILATLIAIFYTEEDWRGWHDWNQYKKKLGAQGVQLDFKAFIPKPVPADQNFFMAPIFAGLSKEYYLDEKLHIGRRNTNVVDRLRMSIYGSGSSIEAPHIGYWVNGTTTDLEAWQQYYRALAAKTGEFQVPTQPGTPAADVLLALSKHNSTIEALRQASRRPYSRLPLDYENRPAAATEMFPYLVDLKSCTQVLQLRAIAELQEGESQKAADDAKLILRLSDSLRTPPFLISYLVHIATTSIALQSIYEGLAKHQWTDAQLMQLEQALAESDFLKDCRFSLRSDEAGSLSTIDYYRRHRLTFARLFYAFGYFGLQPTRGTWDKVMSICKMIGIYLMPNGWFYQNEVALVQAHRWDTKMVDTQHRLVSPEAIDKAGETDVAWRAKPWNFLARESSLAISATAAKTARVQVDVDLALTACALERYRLAYGKYPRLLDALAPQFIKRVPHDIFGGKPLRYRRTADGIFVLYSIGWNEKDDGGVFAYPPGETSGTPVFRGLPHGDWVWRYPAK